MQRLPVAPRHDWKETAERLGFDFHTMYGKPYWFEEACYRFTLDQIERDLEDPSAELMAMCLEVVARAARDDELLHSLAIPEPWWQPLRDSWQRGDPALYARFDLSYNGQGPAKLLELNGDTPTALYESAFFQWIWLEQATERGLIAPGCDQFNSIQEALIAAFGRWRPGMDRLLSPPYGGGLMHFACVAENPEDLGNTRYLQDCAHQAGLATELIFIEEIGVDAVGRLTDLDDRVIQTLFKLYPWEFLVEEDYGVHLIGPEAPRMIEPLWKMVLSNKGLLVWLWRLFPGHPNLLPAGFAERPWPDGIGPRHVIKPLLSREGANIRLVDPALPGGVLVQGGPYGAEGAVVQAAHPLPIFRDLAGAMHHAVIGSWLCGGHACGIGVREDDGPITVNTSRFVPHVIAE
ncbi:MAG: hypothetical protein GC191_20605 [Azospirillum sp.]|nr:hypothetical protein [Azospirillum sp.]